jgi:hypothetical protein
MNDGELRVLHAVRREELNGRPGTAANVAGALGHEDRASVLARLDALVAANQLEREPDDQVCVDCDWPANALTAYRLTAWGRAAIAADGTQAAHPGELVVDATGRHAGWRQGVGAQAVEDFVELGIQAFDKTGDIREALIEAAVQAWQAGHAAGEADQGVAVGLTQGSWTRSESA